MYYYILYICCYSSYNNYMKLYLENQRGTCPFSLNDASDKEQSTPLSLWLKIIEEEVKLSFLPWQTVCDAIQSLSSQRDVLWYIRRVWERWEIVVHFWNKANTCVYHHLIQRIFKSKHTQSGSVIVEAHWPVLPHPVSYPFHHCWMKGTRP